MASFDSTQIPCGDCLTNKETRACRSFLIRLDTFTLFQLPRRRVKAPFMSGVFAHLDVAQAV